MDRVNNASQARVANLMVAIFDKVDHHSRKEEQLLALAGAFILQATALKVPAQDAFSAVKSLMYDPLTDDQLVPQFGAMVLYLQEDVLNG